MSLPTKVRIEIEKLTAAFQALQNLGFQQIMYAPTDGTEIEVIELGSSGIHKAHHMDSGFWVASHGDLWPSRPVLWRKIKQPLSSEDRTKP